MSAVGVESEGAWATMSCLKIKKKRGFARRIARNQLPHTSHPPSSTLHETGLRLCLDVCRARCSPRAEARRLGAAIAGRGGASQRCYSATAARHIQSFFPKFSDSARPDLLKEGKTGNQKLAVFWFLIFSFIRSPPPTMCFGIFHRN
jgi:hypothetical protein